VALASDLGIANVLRFLRRAGFTTFDRTAAYYGLGLTLGNAEVRLDELASAYAAFARGGEWRPARARLDPEPHLAAPAQLVSPHTAYWITDVLADDEARAFIFGRGSQLEFPFRVAVKTGTSQAYHDNWTVGSSRHVTVGVWVGNFDRSPLIGSSGVTGAGPLFQAVMLAAEARVAGGIKPSDDAVLDPPSTLVDATICGLSGMRAGDACPVRRRERLAPDAPQVAGAACTWHQAAHGELATLWPERYRGWAEASGLRSPVEREAEARVAPRGEAEPRGDSASGGTQSLTPRHAHTDPRPRPRPRQGSASATLQVVHPAAGTVFLIDPTLRAEFQALPFRAVGSGGGQVSWTVNGRPVGSAGGDAAVLWPLQRGSHVAVVRDTRGRSAEVSFVVK
jgi:penicillin-binding protein 1C